MRKLVILLLASLVATNAFALSDDGEDSFGLYFDPNFDANSTFATGIVNAYMVIANPTADSIGGFEITFAVTEAGAAPIGTFWVVPGVDVDDTPTGVAVGFSEPIEVVNDAIGRYAYLGDFQMIVFGATEITAGPALIPSLPGVPVYADGENLDVLVPLSFSVDGDGQNTDELGWLTIPLAAINGEAPVAAEDATWSNVKGMFR